MVNKIWGFFIISGIIFSLFTGNIKLINEEILACTKSTIDMVVKIFPVMALWLGIMQIASSSGLLTIFSTKLSIFLSKIFPILIVKTQ